METTTLSGSTKQEDEQDRWIILFRIAAVSGAIMIALIFVDTAISTVAPDSDNIPGSLTVVEWLELFHTDAFRAARDLGVLNILNSVLNIPVYFALYILHRQEQPALASLSFILFLFGSSIYISNNSVLPMLTLSDQYAAVTTEAQRLSLVAAGEAVLARGADFTPGSLIGFVLPSLASILMAYVVLRGRVFGTFIALAGLVGFTCLLIYTVWVILIPSAFDTALLIAIPGGLGVLVWNGILVNRFFNLDSNWAIGK